MNWGNKLLLVFILFGTGLTFLVYKSTTTNYELVEKDYYKQEITYQEVINATKKTATLSNDVSIRQTSEEIVIQFPPEMKNKTTNGQIWFYCAYNSKQDKKIKIKTNTGATQTIPTRQITPGNYTIKITWTDELNNYYTEKTFKII